SSRGLRWQAPQVSLKICAGDLPASRFDWAEAGTAASTATTPIAQVTTLGTTRPTRTTMTPPSQPLCWPSPLLEIFGQKEDVSDSRLSPAVVSSERRHLIGVAVAKRLCFNSSSGRAVGRARPQPDPFAPTPVDANYVVGVARRRFRWLGGGRWIGCFAWHLKN